MPGGVNIFLDILEEKLGPNIGESIPRTQGQVLQILNGTDITTSCAEIDLMPVSSLTKFLNVHL